MLIAWGRTIGTRKWCASHTDLNEEKAPNTRLNAVTLCTRVNTNASSAA